MDGLLRLEAEATLKRTAIRLVKKWKQPYSRTCGHVKGGVSITLVRATHHFILVSWVPTSKIIVQMTQWEDGDGLHLFL